MSKVIFCVLVVALFLLTGCIGKAHFTSPVPRTVIRGADGSYILIAPKRAHIEWATTWPFSYPYGNQNKGGK